jgi:transmembrane sensor
MYGLTTPKAPGQVTPGQVTPGQRRQAIDQEAARLLHMARDSGREEDWAQVYRWVEQDPAHGVAFARAEASWDMAEALRASTAPQGQGREDSPPPANDDARERPARGDEHNDDHDDDAAPARPGPRLTRRAFAALAAGSGVAVAAALGWRQVAIGQRYATAVGEARVIQLADGSKVRLNTDSEIDVSLQRERRTVHFLKGEARFDVAHDPARPFVITARDGALQAVGTVFNLRQRKDFTELTVIEGKVAVLDDGTPTATVPAGAAAMIRAAAVSVMRLTPEDMERRTAWQQGEIHLEGETLAQAVDEFNRYRTKPLVIGDPDLSSLRMGGMFSARNSQDFVEALKQSFGIRVMEGQDGAVILLPETGKDLPDHKAV